MKKLIYEDSTKMNVQRQVMGMKNSTDPKPNLAGALLKTNQADDNSRAPTLKPYPLNLADDVLSDMYMATLNLQKLVVSAKDNPALEEKYHKVLDEMDQKLTIISGVVVELSEDLDTIGNVA